MNTRVRSAVLAAGSIAILSIACSDGMIEGQLSDEATNVQPNSSGAAAVQGIGGVTVTGGSGTGAPSTPSIGQSGSGNVAMGGAPVTAGMGSGGASGQPNTTPQGGDTAQAGGPQAGAGGSGSQAGASGSSSQSGSSNGGGGGSSGRGGGSSGSGGSTGGSVTSCSSISDYGVVSSTIVVKNGQTYDGMCRRYRADPDKLGDGSQDEGQDPVFRLENGARLINVVLGAPAADGIHTEGNVTLENITWEDIGEDALTIKESGTVVLNGGSAKNGADKVFQINAAATFRVSNFKASNAGKMVRQNGQSSFKAAIFIDKCDIANMSESIARTDSSTSTVSLTNSRYHAIGDKLFIGFQSGNITQSNNTQY
jgi:hypothetical protein